MITCLTYRAYTGRKETDMVYDGLQLPSLWVYVWYDDGTRETVANTDTLEPREAEDFAKRWGENRKKKVIRVTLEDNRGKIHRKYRF